MNKKPELTKEHLAPYFPYDLKCWVKDYPLDVGEQPTNDIYILNGLYSNGECVFHDLVESVQGFKDIKPILRPLSDLTDEQYHQIGLSDIRVLRFAIRYQTVSMKALELLLSNHFDVFGLIEKGLALDENSFTNG